MAEYQLSFADSGKVLNIRVGDTVIIRLTENATTGFKWGPCSHTPATVELEAEEGISAQVGAIGAGGSESVFRFRAKNRGHADIWLKLTRNIKSKESLSAFNVALDIS